MLWHNQICTFSIHLIVISPWRWQQYQPKHVGENIVHKYKDIEVYFDGCLYILDNSGYF